MTQSENRSCKTEENVERLRKVVVGLYLVDREYTYVAGLMSLTVRAFIILRGFGSCNSSELLLDLPCLQLLALTLRGRGGSFILVKVERVNAR